VEAEGRNTEPLGGKHEPYNVVGMAFPPGLKKQFTEKRSNEN